VKASLAIAMLIGGLMTASAQDVFVLGGAGTTPVPPIVYQPPVVTGQPAYQPAYQPVAVAVPVCAQAVYPAPCASTYYNPNVIYVGGTCSPGYYDYGYYSSPNVIYFGRRQAYREGYSFGR
jgi:hypothetical protein